MSNIMPADTFCMLTNALFKNQSEAAKILGVTRSTVSRYCLGQVPVPGPVAALMSILNGYDSNGDIMTWLRISAASQPAGGGAPSAEPQPGDPDFDPFAAAPYYEPDPEPEYVGPTAEEIAILERDNEVIRLRDLAEEEAKRAAQAAAAQVTQPAPDAQPQPEAESTYDKNYRLWQAQQRRDHPERYRDEPATPIDTANPAPDTKPGASIVFATEKPTADGPIGRAILISVPAKR